MDNLKRIINIHKFLYPSYKKNNQNQQNQQNLDIEKFIKLSEENNKLKYNNFNKYKQFEEKINNIFKN